MAAMHFYPVLNISETYIRECIYDSLPAETRAATSMEEFRQSLSPEDYRYFASVLSDLLNDYVTEQDLFSQFVAGAVEETVSKSEALAKLYMAKNINRTAADDAEDKAAKK